MTKNEILQTKMNFWLKKWNFDKKLNFDEQWNFDKKINLDKQKNEILSGKLTFG